MQKLKLGDKVRFVDEKLEGIITSVYPDNTFGVTIEDGFEIPSPAFKLVKIALDIPEAEPEKSEKKVKKSTPEQIGIFAAFKRINENTLTLILYNNLSTNGYFVCYQKQGELYKTLLNGTLLNCENIETGKNFLLNDFDNWKNFHFQFLLFEPQSLKIHKPFEAVLNLNATIFHKSLKYCSFLNQQAFVFKLDDIYAQKEVLKKLTEKDFNERTTNKQPANIYSKPDEVVDLHIDVLYAKGYSKNAVTIDLQMEVFKNSLEAAHIHGMPCITFIHGIGTQLLKNKIHAFLKTSPLVKKFEIADSLKYGSGATLVWLK